MAKEQIEVYCEECPTCHILSWISQQHHERLVKSKETFYCPNGHSQSYSGKTDVQRLKESEDEKKRLREYWDESCVMGNEYYDKWKKAEKKLKKLKPKKIKKKVLKKK